MARKQKSAKKSAPSSAKKTQKVVASHLPKNPGVKMFPNLSLRDVIAPPAAKIRRKKTWTSEEARQRQLAALRPIQPGEYRGSAKRKPRRRPFHEAAQLIADSDLTALNINPNDTVAAAIIKRLGHKALMAADVPAAKEFADRAEGAAQVVRTDGEDGDTVVQNSMGDILVRFGVQLNISNSDSE